MNIVELLLAEANCTEELNPEDSEISVMRDAARIIQNLVGSLRLIAAFEGLTLISASGGQAYCWGATAAFNQAAGIAKAALSHNGLPPVGEE